MVGALEDDDNDNDNGNDERWDEPRDLCWVRAELLVVMMMMPWDENSLSRFPSMFGLVRRVYLGRCV